MRPDHEMIIRGFVRTARVTRHIFHRTTCIFPSKGSACRRSPRSGHGARGECVRFRADDDDVSCGKRPLRKRGELREILAKRFRRTLCVRVRSRDERTGTAGNNANRGSSPRPNTPHVLSKHKGTSAARTAGISTCADHPRGEPIIAIFRRTPPEHRPPDPRTLCGESVREHPTVRAIALKRDPFSERDRNRRRTIYSPLGSHSVRVSAVALHFYGFQSERTVGGGSGIKDNVQRKSESVGGIARTETHCPLEE